MKKMIKRLQNMLKEERGLTLIELLAVVVILGIIAAIAVPSVINITSDTRKEAVIAGYKSMTEATRLLVTKKGWEAVDGSSLDEDNAKDAIIVSLGTLKAAGLMERSPQKFDNPSSNYGDNDMKIKAMRSVGTITYYALKIGGTSSNIDDYVAVDALTVDNFKK